MLALFAALFIWFTKRNQMSEIRSYKESLSLTLLALGLPTLFAAVIGIIYFDITVMMAIQSLGMVLMIAFTFIKTRFKQTDDILELGGTNRMTQRLFEIDEWKLKSKRVEKDAKRLQESLTSLGNGYMGMRGNFEERYSGDTHQGTYVAGVWYPDKTRVGWWKNGYPDYFGKVINALNFIGIDVKIDGETLDLFQDTVTDFNLELDMETGILRRSFEVTKAGKAFFY